MRPNRAAFLASAILVLGLHFSCSSPDRQVEKTSELLNRMAGEIKMLAVSDENALSGDIDYLLAELNKQSAYDKERPISYPGIEQGLDAWGRPILLDRRSDSEIVLRSLGPNGHDDAGRADDIQVNIGNKRGQNDF